MVSSAYNGRVKDSLSSWKHETKRFDYINTSMGLLSEVSQKARGVGMREDQILFLLSQTLKELAVDLNIFVLSSTQTNAELLTGSNLFLFIGGVFI